MTTTPLATIADALIEFILGLLRDPDAAAAFEEDPDASLAYAGLGDICAADVRSVLPVVVDRPEVVSVSPPDLTVTTPPPTVIVRPHPEQPKHDLMREIKNVINNFSIDNRATIVDQSVNQSIWAEGDVTQFFDQEAVIAAGDHSVAAGKDADVDNSTTDIDAGDIAIGNTDTHVVIDDAFNDGSTHVDVVAESDIDDSFNDQSSAVSTEVSVEDSFIDTTETTVEQSIVVNDPPPTPQTADPTVYVEEPTEESTDYADETMVEEPPLDEDFEDQP